MTPRFSILALLGITAYAAVTLAGVSNPGSIWIRLNVYLWIGLLIWFGIEVAFLHPRRAKFGWGFLCGCLGYLLGCYVESLAVSPHPTSMLEFLGGIMPHHFLVNYVFGLRIPNLGGVPGPRILYDFSMTMWGITNCSIATGVLGGCVALWRYRVLERHESKEKAAQ